MRTKQLQLLLIFTLVAILFVQAIGVTQTAYSSEIGAGTGSHDLVSGSHAEPVKAPAGINVNGAVNPNQYYTHEPAPMGIADFGIGPGGLPYYYNTTSFLGTVRRALREEIKRRRKEELKKNMDLARKLLSSEDVEFYVKAVRETRDER